jgi:hypothetical protein
MTTYRRISRTYVAVYSSDPGSIGTSSANISEIEMLSMDYDEINAKEYRDSEPLDLDALSLTDI